MLNALSIDVEDYYQVSGFESRVRFEEWPSHESRVIGNTWRLLELLGFHRVKATFFILGWIAERHPQVVQAIRQEGHEIASHGYRHRLLYTMTREEFREDVRRTKAILEELSGEPVIGYRAPSFSIVQDNLWCLDVLQELGFEYDSSLFPIAHDRYGIAGGSRLPYYHTLSGGKRMLEFPPSTVRLLGQNVPVAGGGYFRLFPYRFIRWAIRRLNQHEGAPAIVYLHPWEIDPAQPRINGSLLNRFRHYVNLKKTEPRLRRLLKDFQFVPIRELAASMGPCVTGNGHIKQRTVAPLKVTEGAR
jgi:polysaccharide deacetylase family protein (PEP-CTERM system associated)